MRKNNSYSLSILSIGTFILIANVPCIGQDSVLIKKNEIGFTLGTLGDPDRAPGNGMNIVYNHWNSKNRAARFGLSWYQFINQTRYNSIVENINGVPVLISRENNNRTDDYTISYGQLFSKNLYPKLKVYFAYDLHAGITRRHSVQYVRNEDPMNGYWQNNIIKYNGGVIKIVPSVGIKLDVSKRVTLTAEVSAYPLRLSYYQSGRFSSYEGNLPHDLSARIGVSIRF